MYDFKYFYVVSAYDQSFQTMSLVANTFAPVFLIGLSGISLFRFESGATLKVAGCMAINVALQLLFVRRFALGGSPSNAHGIFALLYPLFLAMSVALMLVASAGTQTSMLGASQKKHVYQYRLNDVIDRVRDIVGDRISRSSDDHRER